MKYDFDKLTERRGTYSCKWEVPSGELPMWIADMDFETAPAVKRAVLDIAEGGIYGYSTMPDGFFSALSDFRKRRHGHSFLPGEAVFSTGVVAALSSLVRKLTTPAENVLIQAPVYNIFYNSILNNGRNVMSSDLVFDGKGYSIDFADLEAKLSDKQTSLMIVCNPHNPVGRIWTREELAKIGELCKKYGVTVISDEIHSDILRPGLSYTPFSEASEVCREISLSCVSAAKSFNLAGLQAAAVVAHNPTLRHKAYRALNTDECGEPNIFAMAANIAAFEKGDEWLDALVKYLFENRSYAEELISKSGTRLKCVHSDATYFLWVDVSHYTSDVSGFCRRLREKSGLYVSSGASYGGSGEGFVRINLATQRARVCDGIKRLIDYVLSTK